MVTLQTLETQGYARTFFRLPETTNSKEQWLYYTYDTNIPSYQTGYWDIIGIFQRKETSLLLDCSLLHIDEEALDWEPFEALRDADNYLSVNPEKVEALIRFFEVLLAEHSGSGSHTRGVPGHFHQLTTDELVSLHVNPWQIERNTGYCYQYLPDEQIKNTGQISLIRFPQWLTKGKVHQNASLEFATFDRQRLANPEFNPFGITEWLGNVTFDQSALEEFLQLLKEHTYENAVSGM